jgi:hypothetical protein
MMGLEEAVRSLNALGIEYKALDTGTDGAAIILPEYGRVLGLWPYWRGENALWINPDFFRSLQIGSKQTEWLNPGGDRMWLYPEAEFFVPDQEHPTESYSVPQALDPGAYCLTTDKDRFCMENHGSLWAFRAGARIGFKITRRLRVFDEAEISGLWGTTYLRQAGFEEETVLEIKDSPIAVGLWNAAYMRTGGRAYLTLERYLSGTALSGLPAATRELSAGCAAIACGGDAQMRIWLDVVESKSRGAYVFDNEEIGRSTMLLKEIEKGAAAQYAREPGGRSSVLGFSCSGSHARSCELGFRSTATGGPAGRKKVAWRTSTWAFSGRTEEVRALVSRLTA